MCDKSMKGKDEGGYMNRGIYDCQMEVQVIGKIDRSMDRCVGGQMCE